MQRMRSSARPGWTAWAGPAVVVALIGGVSWWAWVAMGSKPATSAADTRLSLSGAPTAAADPQRTTPAKPAPPKPTPIANRDGRAAGATPSPASQPIAPPQTPTSPALAARQDEVLMPRDGRPAGSTSLTPVAPPLGPSTPPPIALGTPPQPTLLQATTPATSQPLAPAPGASPTTPKPAPVSPAPSFAPRGGAADAAKRKLLAGDVIGARTDLNAALKASRSDGPPERELRDSLAEIANRCTFSKEIVAGDSLVDQHKVNPGDRLIKLSKSWKVPYEIILSINNIQSERKIRAGQTIKTLRGPFNARISKSQFRIDLYLQDTYVRSFSVGLGADNGTPEGEWKVDNRLKNPTYYPPASSDKKKIISPDDPANPLGEHWIGLTGVGGAAKGQEGFGIHGTIDPNSIGKNASMGCVRMRNEDVAFVFSLLEPGASIVTIVP